MNESVSTQAGQGSEGMNCVHGLWVGKSLSLLEQLSIRLYQRLGYDFVLWLYDECEGVPRGAVQRDASEILPRNSIFRYTGRPLPGFATSGIGSVAHWSEQFQMKLLYEHGGIYSQLDVTLLEPIDLSSPYVFVKGNTIETCFMKCPKGSDFALATFNTLQKAINRDTVHTIDWCDSMDLVATSIGTHGLAAHVLPEGIFLSGTDFNARAKPDSVKLIHWWNVALGNLKHYPARGSLYARLLVESGLWEPSVRNSILYYSNVAGRHISDLWWRAKKLPQALQRRFGQP
jgi:hypothetical protein